MMECVFCQIVRKQVQASFVYEDETVAAFLSYRPVNVGHTLVIPKRHYVNIYEMPENEVAYLFKIAKRVAHAVRDATGNDAIRIVQNNGKYAGQVIFHMHVHIIPMKEGNHFWYKNDLRPSDLLDLDALKIKQKIESKSLNP